MSRSPPARPVLAAVVLAVVAPAIGPLAVGPPTVSASATPAANPLPTGGTEGATVTGSARTATTRPNAPTPDIVAVYPNPATDGDRGEFVVLRVPERTALGNWSLADGESAVRLPNRTVSGRVAVSPDPDVARNLTEAPVLGMAGDLSLANAGETVRLVGNGSTAGSAETRVNAATSGSVTYEDAPEGERWHRVEASEPGPARRPNRTGRPANRTGSDADWRWTPLGATDFGVLRTGRTAARAFVLPDSPDVPVETLRGADRRILLAGYTFTSERAADALAAASRRGVTVRVLVDAAPVGGLPRREARLLDSLVARGVGVRVLGGSRARYDFHHAKYAVVDDRALVTTENWKPAGTGGRSSRGWGAVVRSDAVAGRLAAVFAADAGWRGATPWSEFRSGRSFEPADAGPANGTYPSRIAPTGVNASSSSVLVAPDNAERALLDLLGDADESIRVQQVAVGGRRHSLLQATLRAARRGVEVRILLSGAWYVEEDNRALVEWLNRRAAAENLPLEARLAKPRGRYEKIHAKGLVVDGETAVVGSVNWNNHSVRANREVAVVLRGREAGGFYADAFDADWRASAGGRGSGRVPVGLLAAVALGALAAILYARREVAFER